ncbi:MAG: hypothetical protein ABSA93_19020 [Streptosporangiaceae bacterium]|jgi:hypothetical protein
MEMEYDRQRVIDVLQRTGQMEAAAAVERELPERVSRQELEDFLKRYGIWGQENLINNLGGSP